VKLVIQRVKSAEVAVDKQIVGKIKAGMLVFLGIAKGDGDREVDYLTEKILQLRIFDDAQGKMNRSIQEAGGEFLVVSQFTLLGDCDKGRRPSFDGAAAPHLAESLYNQFVEKLRSFGVKVETGKFQAMMDVSLVNDGPVTFILESRS